jgi:hypothetical protein
MFNIKKLNEEERFALLVGILIGDGCLSHCVSNGKNYFILSITGNYYDDKPFYNSVVIPLVNSLRDGRKPIKFRDRQNYGKIEINFSDKELFSKISSLGFPVGKKGPDLIIPSIFYKRGLLKYIIQGFFATDGSLVLTKNPNKFYPRIEAHTIHKDLIKQIHTYLTTLGMVGHFYFCKSKPDPRWKVVQDQYRFQFNGKKNLLVFEEKIGFVNPKHKKKFLNFLEYSKKYDGGIKGVSSKNTEPIREPINYDFIRKMAALGVEPRTPSS